MQSRGLSCLLLAGLLSCHVIPGNFGTELEVLVVSPALVARESSSDSDLSTVIASIREARIEQWRSPLSLTIILEGGQTLEPKNIRVDSLGNVHFSLQRNAVFSSNKVEISVRMLYGEAKFIGTIEFEKYAHEPPKEVLSLIAIPTWTEEKE